MPSRKPNGMLLGQYNTEAILRKHIERLGGTVEYGTELRSFEQHPDHVDAVLVKTVGDMEETEHVTAHWLVGSDGAKGTVVSLKIRQRRSHMTGICQVSFASS